MTWEDARYADCAKVADWVEEQGFARAARQLRERHDPTMTVWALDNKLLPLGLHVEHLPNDVWVAAMQRAA